MWDDMDFIIPDGPTYDDTTEDADTEVVGEDQADAISNTLVVESLMSLVYK